jgi:lysophospholipid acyltransferase (LPLAT)-like uncharacterized protein
MGAAVLAGSAAVQGLGRTWRIETPGVAAYDRVLAAGERCIFAFWHARLLPLVYTHRHRGIAVMVSRHHDGELIARILERLGFGLARGSSTRGGDEAIRDMLEHAAERRLLAITPDGPRGPRERAKAGIVYLASRTGFPVVPVATAADRAWVFRSWDRFRVPQPFARVRVAYGEPIRIPAALDQGAAELWRARVEEAIAALTFRLGVDVGERA